MPCPLTSAPTSLAASTGKIRLMPRGIGWVAWVAVIALAAGCGSPQRDGLTQRLSIATGGTGGVYYPYGGGIAKVISDHLGDVEATAEVTAGTVDNLKFIGNRSADVAFALADSLDDAYMGVGAFAEFGAVPARAIAVLYDNYNHVVTSADSGIGSVQDLEGRVVSTGAPGSGTEISAFRILEAAGVDYNAGFRRQSLGAAQSVDAIKDGKIDAFFWSGGIPTGSLLDLATTPGLTIRLIATETLLPTLEERYGAEVYHVATIPVSTYPGMTDAVPTVAVANVLVVHEAMDADVARRITEALFVGYDELAAIHPMAALLSLETAVTGSPVPFHAGAVTYYREQRAWSEER